MPPPSYEINLTGDAICSYGVLERASRVLFGGDVNFQDLLSLFSLLEASVLYKRLLYVPFGDTSQGIGAQLELVRALIKSGVAAIELEEHADEDVKGGVKIRKNWEALVRAIGNIPATKEIDEATTLSRAFHHAFAASASMYHSFGVLVREDNRFNEPGLLTKEGMEKWKQNIIDPTVSSYDWARFMDWERLVIFLARSTFAKELKADYVCDAMEQPIVEVGVSLSRNNLAVQLYEKLSKSFSIQHEALKLGGFPSTISVPPIVTLVLERADGSPDSIIKELMALREEFSDFRKKYVEYSRALSAPEGKTLGELVDEQKDLIQEVGAALDMVTAGRVDSRVFHEFVGGQIKPAGGSDEDMIDIQPALSLSALVKLGLKKWEISRIQGRAQSLFDIWAKVMKIENYHSLVSRKLGFEVTRDEYSNYRRYAQVVEETLKVRR
jgi:hypothetical protein